MAKLNVSDFLIYRWRYKLGYLAIAIACIALLVIASLYIPGGLSEREVRGVATTNALSIKQYTPDMVVNLPYYLSQKLSFFSLGISEISVKLSTLLIGFMTVIGLVLLLRMWFKPNVAILTALICMTTGPFLLAIQSGTPGILYIFWPVWLLYCATMISRRALHPLLWKILFFILASLSLYTPLSIYMLVALISAAVLHPHLRHLIKGLSKLRISAGLCIASIILIPLIYSLVLDPSILYSLLGIPPSIDLLDNMKQLYHQYADILHPTNGIIMTPVYEIASLLLVGLGLYRILTAKYTARSYILSTWLILLLPILFINPQLVNMTFVPFLLLTGYGIDFLIRYWYRLFPRNPYARVVGLIPIMIFITSLILSGIDRFVYGYLYNPSSSRDSSHDLSLLKNELTSHTKGVIALVVAPSEKPFYEAVKRYNPKLNIQLVTSDVAAAKDGTIVVSRNAPAKPPLLPEKVVTSSHKTDADRFYIYKNTAQ